MQIYNKIIKYRLFMRIFYNKHYFLTNAIIYKQKAPDENIGCLKFHR